MSASEALNDAVSASTELRDDTLLVRTTRSADDAGCAPGCDADRDGLSDAWEDAVLRQLRPWLALHPDEPVIDDHDGHFGYVARMFRPANGPRDIVRAIIVTGISFDPGEDRFFGVTAHDGDSERLAVELRLRDDGREAVLERAYFAVHEGEVADRSRTYSREEIAEELTFRSGAGRGPVRWVVFPSLGKHAQFANPEECNSSSFKGIGVLRERCPASTSEGRLALPEIVNAGEPDHHRASDLAELGFPGEDAWEDQPFCGGLRARARHRRCASSIASKLLDDPFAAAAR